MIYPYFLLAKHFFLNFPQSERKWTIPWSRVSDYFDQKNVKENPQVGGGFFDFFFYYN